MPDDGVDRPGSKTRPGARGCGQLETATMTFISARKSTMLPGAAPAFQRKRPSSSVAMSAKKVIAGGTSGRRSPSLPAARRKLSRLLRRLASPKARALEAGVLPPSIVSLAPKLSAVIEQSMRPISENSTRPLVRARGPLQLHGVAGVVALAGVVGVPEEDGDARVAGGVDQPKGLATRDAGGPIPAAGDGFPREDRRHIDGRQRGGDGRGGGLPGARLRLQGIIARAVLFRCLLVQIDRHAPSCLRACATPHGGRAKAAESRGFQRRTD